MKFLVAIALLALAVAEAHHSQLHTLRGPRFKRGRLYTYDVELNVTSSVLGLSSQASKVALKAEVSIYAKTDKEHLLKVEKVYTSDSVPAVDSIDGDIPMKRDSELEGRLSVPIKFMLENGLVTSYTLSPRESLESKKIKKSILRSLEMYISEEAQQELEGRSGRAIPVTYNVTKDTEDGEHATYYMITISPEPEFPDSMDVYNITRTEDFEGERYPSHLFHHNFQKQGCPEVCRKDLESNEYGSGCPFGYEPHHTPIKMALSQQQHLSLQDDIMNPEIIRTVETHVANMYDQDMQVLIIYELRRTKISTGRIEEPSGQQTYRDLSDLEVEINDKEIDELCGYKSSREAIESVKKLLREISVLIVKGDLNERESSRLGERIILLKNALTRLSVADLKEVSLLIKSRRGLSRAREEEKVMRQIWLDVLPLIGTEEAVTFIVSYIKEKVVSDLLVWEAKELIEALPQNIHTPSERNIRELRSLINDRSLSDKINNNHLLHSAVHLTLARVIETLCDNTVTNPSPVQKSTWSSNYHDSFHTHGQFKSSSESSKCPEGLIKEIVQEISENLKRSQKKEDIAVYIDALSHIGIPEVLPVIAEYVYGVAENIQSYSPRYIDFVKTVSLYSLHNLISRNPEEVLEIVLPVFFNETEVPKVRIAAFTVLIRSQPSLSILQQVVIRSWTEPSNEVGSFVTSTLETFGNSTLPCMQLTADRIKKVLPQLNRFDIGLQHSQNILLSYFDDLREFGLEKRFSYTASNESIFPSSLYHSLSYSMDSLTDYVTQLALNIEGLTQEMVMQKIENFLGVPPPAHFDKSQEREIFGDAMLNPRIPDPLRFTIYKRLFYRSSYNYYEVGSENVLIKHFMEYVDTYLKTSNLDYTGHLVRMFLPSTFHTITNARTIPYPVEFEMKQPIVFALKVVSKERDPSHRRFHFHIRPSVYATKLYTNQLKNIGDCKEVGVYHEHKISMVYPFELKFEGINFPNVTIKYRVPELSKKVLTYFSESGTYAGKKDLETLPATNDDREPIETIPSPFMIEEELNLVGVPPLRVQMYTEDIGLTKERLPKDLDEALEIVVRKVLNAGWRRQSINITLLEDSRRWSRDTEVTFSIEYAREHVTKEKLRPYPIQYSKKSMSQNGNHQWSSQFATERQPPESQWSSHWATERQPPEEQWSSQWATERQPAEEQWSDEWRTERQPPEEQWSDEWRTERQPPESQWSTEDSSRSWFGKKFSKREKDEDWPQDLTPNDVFSNTDPSVFINQGRKISYQLNTQIPHIAHVLKVQVETKPVSSSAFIRVEYNHTYCKSLQTFHVNAAVRPPRKGDSYDVSIDHMMGYVNKPDEFKYDTHKENQMATFITALSLQPGLETNAWDKVEAVIKGVFEYESLEEYLKDELLGRVPPEAYLPETHEECLRDIREGEALSMECVKAVRERSIYNKLRMSILWEEGLPDILKILARRVDIYAKHYLFHHLNLTDELNNERNSEKRIRLTLHHIDKFTDEPVYDLKVEKPTETFEFRRVPTGGLQPLSSVYSGVQTMLMETTNNTYPPTCVMMEKYVRTYDLETYEFSPESCSYVLSSHCSEYKNFAVLVKGLDKSKGTKEIRIHVGKDVIVLTPRSESMYKIEYNGKEYTLQDPVLLDDSDTEIYAYTETYEENAHILVRARKAGLRVLYDGINVKVEVDPRYKGELCGLCSEFDGEILREYRGLGRCLYSHPMDFANSAVTKREGQCQVDRLHGRKMCDDSDESSPDEEGRQESVPSLKRNIVMSKGNEYCFSTLPVPTCENHERPVETENLLVPFHCLPKRDVTAKKLLTESKRRVLEEIAFKKADFEETVQVAKKC